ncbi:MAG: DUF4259 domain-containing protein [Terriglobales bacterium]
MAGWGTGSFENDDAQDWLAQLPSLAVEDLKPLLARAADNDDYLEAPESSIAVAAAEAVATLKGAPAPTAPPAILDWARKAKDGLQPDLKELALRAVQRVRANSELKDLWLQAEGLNEWSTALRDLEKRLTI